MGKLKECPFCGGSEIEMQGFSQDGQRYFWPQCMQCGSGCKEKTSHDEAAKLWNTRITPTPPTGQVEAVARALWEKQKEMLGPVWFHPSETWKGTPITAQNEWIELAKAAITKILEVI